MTETDTARFPVGRRVRGRIERPRSLVDEITARLRADILDGRLVPGQRISAAAVSREMGVSHIPVREALQRLQAGALVESTHHRGATVSRISIDELHEIYDLRRLIEGETVRRAAVRYTDDDLEAIVQAGKRLAAADPTAPATDFWEAHRAFHRALLAPALDVWRNRLLVTLWQSAERYAHLRILVFGSPARANDEHPRLTAIALQRSPERLARALAVHLTTTEKMVTDGYRRILTESRPNPGGDPDLPADP